MNIPVENKLIAWSFRKAHGHAWVVAMVGVCVPS
jgi:hypothetical protein